MKYLEKTIEIYAQILIKNISMIINMDITEIIKKERPDISESTLKAYTLNLKKLNKRITDKNEIESLDFLTDYDKVLMSLGGLMKATMKNYLVAVIVVLMSNKSKYGELINKYQNRIKELQEDINDNYDENEKTEKQEKNWVEYNEVLQLLRKMKKMATPLLDKENLTNKEKDIIQQYLAVYLYSGKAFDVLRNDFSEMKVVNEGDDTDKNKNYFVIKKKGIPYFKLNEYKTAKFQGEKIIPIKDMELRKLINKWAKINGTGFILVNITKNTPMTSNGISKYLNKIFMKHLGKKVSSSLLRSIYITHKYNGKMSIKDKKELANNMTHTMKTAENIYNKID